MGSGSPDQVPDESAAEEDAIFESRDAAAVTLYKVSDAGGSLQVDTISTKPIRQEMLKSDDCFILDTGTAIYVWVGKQATQTEKTQSISRAQSVYTIFCPNIRSTSLTWHSCSTDFIQTKKYPSWTPLHRIVEGAETAPFKQFFATWRDSGMQHTRLIRAANDNDSDSGLEEEIDTNVLRALKKSGGRALGFMPDDGKGDVEVWQIVGKEPVVIDPVSQGVFYGSSCYVVKYHYENKRGGEGYVIYYWQVRWRRCESI